MHPQYKLKESPIPSDEEESSEESSDDEFGPKKPKVDPDDPVARELFKELREVHYPAILILHLSRQGKKEKHLIILIFQRQRLRLTRQKHVSFTPLEAIMRSQNVRKGFEKCESL